MFIPTMVEVNEKRIKEVCQRFPNGKLLAQKKTDSGWIEKIDSLDVETMTKYHRDGWFVCVANNQNRAIFNPRFSDESNEILNKIEKHPEVNYF